MKYIIYVIMAMVLISMASGDIINISGKNYTDFKMFNGTDMLASDDLAGVSMSDMGIDESFVRDNPIDGRPINQNKSALKIGSAVGYDRTAQWDVVYFYTTAELTNSQAWNKSLQ